MRNRETVWLSDEDKTLVRSFLIEEDDQIMAFNKPAGLACQTRDADDHTLDKLLWAFARSNGKRPRLVHRIDADTTGVVLAAKTQPAAVALSKAFENRSMRKTYLALVQGNASRLSRVDSPIGTLKSGHSLISGIGGKPGVKDVREAVTKFRCISASDRFSLVECHPETGRMHQIRIHLAHAGFPILGDAIYGEGTSAKRLMLHALRLQGPHPIGGEFDISADVPDDFERMAGEII